MKVYEVKHKSIWDGRKISEFHISEAAAMYRQNTLRIEGEVADDDIAIIVHEDVTAVLNDMAKALRKISDQAEAWRT